MNAMQIIVSQLLLQSCSIIHHCLQINQYCL